MVSYFGPKILCTRKGKLQSLVLLSIALATISWSCNLFEGSQLVLSFYRRVLFETDNSQENRQQRPIMHTFYQKAYGNIVDHKDFIELWKRAWEASGWEPVILNEDDAKKHPLYEEFHLAFEKAEFEMLKYDRMCFYRWLAMAVSGGGWMSDYDTYPSRSKPYEDALTLPNEGKFTSFQGHVPALVVGSESEWNRLAELLLNSYKKHNKEFWSDMFALLEVIQSQNNGIIAHMDEENEVIAADLIYLDELRKDGKVSDPLSLKSKCQPLEKLRAIHFSHYSCKQLEFCDKETFPSKFVKAWQEQCLAGVTE